MPFFIAEGLGVSEQMPIVVKLKEKGRFIRNSVKSINFLVENLLNHFSEIYLQIDFKGTLFTGHSMSVRGIYQDKSSTIKKYHHLKLVVKSPHFEDTYIKLRYWRDEAEISFNLQVKQNRVRNVK